MESLTKLGKSLTVLDKAVETLAVIADLDIVPIESAQKMARKALDDIASANLPVPTAYLNESGEVKVKYENSR